MMEDLAYKVIALDTLWEDALEKGDPDDVAFDIEMHHMTAGTQLAKAVLERYRSLSRFSEVVAYANRHNVCLDHAIDDLVNAGLSHQQEV